MKKLSMIKAVIVLALFNIPFVGFANVEKKRRFPKLIGQYNVSYTYHSRGYAVEDLVYSSSFRNLSYAILYPTDEEQGERIHLSHFYPDKKGFDPISKTFGPFVDGMKTEKSEDYSKQTALKYINKFYNQFQLNAFHEGRVVHSRKFPVLIFSPGSKGQRNSYLGLLEQLASLGVIVVALDVHHWEMGNQYIYNEVSDSYEKYVKKPNFSEIPSHSHHHMRAEDLRQVYKDVTQQNHRVFEQVDQSKIFFGGHSYGGHSTFYSIRFDLPKVKGHINYDGSFAPYGEDDHYDVSKLKSNTHLLCLQKSTKKGDACNKQFNAFKWKKIEEELESFDFTTLAKWKGISHGDLSNFAFAVEKFPEIVPKKFRNPEDGRKIKDVWSRVAQWSYTIIK